MGRSSKGNLSGVWKGYTVIVVVISIWTECNPVKQQRGTRTMPLYYSLPRREKVITLLPPLSGRPKLKDTFTEPDFVDSLEFSERPKNEPKSSQLPSHDHYYQLYKPNRKNTGKTKKSKPTGLAISHSHRRIPAALKQVKHSDDLHGKVFHRSQVERPSTNSNATSSSDVSGPPGSRPGQNPYSHDYYDYVIEPPEPPPPPPSAPLISVIWGWDPPAPSWGPPPDPPPPPPPPAPVGWPAPPPAPAWGPPPPPPAPAWGPPPPPPAPAWGPPPPPPAPAWGPPPPPPAPAWGPPPPPPAPAWGPPPGWPAPPPAPAWGPPPPPPEPPGWAEPKPEKAKKPKPPKAKPKPEPEPEPPKAKPKPEPKPKPTKSKVKIKIKPEKVEKPKIVKEKEKVKIKEVKPIKEKEDKEKIKIDKDKEKDKDKKEKEKDKEKGKVKVYLKSAWNKLMDLFKFKDVYETEVVQLVEVRGVNDTTELMEGSQATKIANMTDVGKPVGSSTKGEKSKRKKKRQGAKNVGSILPLSVSFDWPSTFFSFLDDSNEEDEE